MKKNEDEPEKVFIDLFKNDVFSIGVTLYEIATGNSIVGINDNKST